MALGVSGDPEPLKPSIAEQEQRLAALGVSGDPKPVVPYAPKLATGRLRSRSPVSTRNMDRDQSYRQRGYEFYRPDQQVTDREQSEGLLDAHAEFLQATMGAEAARNIEARFGNGQQNENRRKGRKGKGKEQPAATKCTESAQRSATAKRSSTCPRCSKEQIWRWQ